jgi:hypothetical protein
MAQRSTIPYMAKLTVCAELLLLLMAIGALVACVPQDPVTYTFEDAAFGPWILTEAEPPGYNTSCGAVVDADTFTPPIPPPGGDWMAYITTLENEGCADFGYNNESPDIDANGEKETEYSAVSITFTTTVRSTVTVDLNFLSSEITHGPPAVSSPDVFGISTGSVREGPYVLLRAIAASQATYTGTAEVLAPSDFTDEFIQDSPAGYPDLGGVSRFNGQTGFETFTFEVFAGTHTWTFFVADGYTDGGASAILIDNFSVVP